MIIKPSRIKALEERLDNHLKEFEAHEAWLEYSEPFREGIQNQLSILSRRSNLIQELEELLK